MTRRRDIWILISWICPGVFIVFKAFLDMFTGAFWFFFGERFSVFDMIKYYIGRGFSFGKYYSSLFVYEFLKEKG